MTSSSVDEARGTIILCDSIHPTIDGKWIIVGTYTNWWSKKPSIKLEQGVGCYVRFQVERILNAASWKIVLFDSATSPNGEKIIEISGSADVRDPNTPVEAGLLLPEFVVNSPVPNEDIPLGTRVALRYRVWLILEDKPIASCPLNVYFLNPQETNHYAALTDAPSKGRSDKPAEQ
jgi:hypothetical protein